MDDAFIIQGKNNFQTVILSLPMMKEIIFMQRIKIFNLLSMHLSKEYTGGLGSLHKSERGQHEKSSLDPGEGNGNTAMHWVGEHVSRSEQEKAGLPEGFVVQNNIVSSNTFYYLRNGIEKLLDSEK